MKRRQLIFTDFSQVLADVQHLQSAGYTRMGNWSLGQIGHHLARAFDGSIRGFDYMQPWYIRLGARPVLPLILWSKRLPKGAKLPKRFEPSPDITDEIGTQRLGEALERFEKHHGPLAPHPFFGKMSNEQWRSLHLIHCAHHLGFLVPEK